MPNAALKPASDPGKQPDPLQKLDRAVIAPRRVRRYRAVAFQAYVLIASIVFVVLAVVAHTVAYFPIDLTITHALQTYHGPAFSRLMLAISWTGYFPQVAVISALIILALFASGLRWEGVSALFATASSGLGALVKLVVLRPRPTSDLVTVVKQLKSPGFPSGHVLATTAFCGFLVFLVFTLLKLAPLRTFLLVVLCSLIALMSVSRVYLGQHWFSDVMGAYLLGSLWLALTIRFYRWGKVRYFVHQPVAAAAPPTSDVGTA